MISILFHQCYSQAAVLIVLEKKKRKRDTTAGRWWEVEKVRCYGKEIYLYLDATIKHRYQKNILTVVQPIVTKSP